MLVSAVKCNDEEPVIAVLAKLGCGFDCASKVSKVIFYVNIKTLCPLAYCVSLGPTHLMTLKLQLHWVFSSHSHQRCKNAAVP